MPRTTDQTHDRKKFPDGSSDWEDVPPAPRTRVDVSQMCPQEIWRRRVNLPEGEWES